MKALRQLARYRLALLGLLVAGVLLGMLSCSLLRSEHDPRFEAIRKAGYPANLRELNNWYAPPDSGNAAPVFTQAFAAQAFSLNDTKGQQLGRLRLPERGTPLSAETKLELASMIASNGAALRLYFSAEGLTNSR